MRKRVYASTVVSSDYDTFESIIAGDVSVLRLNGKSIEISHVHQNDNVISGLFVSTQMVNLAPQHEPGIEADYSAIEIEDGKGLAYPNAFLYDRTRHILFWEVNTQGMNEKKFEIFFNQCDKLNGTNMQCHFYPVVTTDFLERINRLERINSFSLKVGDPIQILNREDASFADMRNLATSAEATGTIEVKVKASAGHTLSIEFIRSQVQSAIRLNRDNGNANINCQTSGFYYDEDDNLESAKIDMLIDKFCTYYELDRVDNASIQAEARKNGLQQAYQYFLRKLAEYRV